MSILRKWFFSFLIFFFAWGVWAEDFDGASISSFPISVQGLDTEQIKMMLVAVEEDGTASFILVGVHEVLSSDFSNIHMLRLSKEQRDPIWRDLLVPQEDGVLFKENEVFQFPVEAIMQRVDNEAICIQVPGELKIQVIDQTLVLHLSQIKGVSTLDYSSFCTMFDENFVLDEEHSWRFLSSMNDDSFEMLLRED